MAEKAVTIARANFGRATVTIRGTAPLVMHKFSAKAREAILEKQTAGSTANKGKKRSARDLEAEVQASIHRSTDGWVGIPAGAFRAAMISACRLVGFKMTIAKLSVFVEADGYDQDDSTPLVKLVAGAPIVHETMGRLETGVCCPIVRPMWHEWRVNLRLKWDADQFTLSDLCNLLDRAGHQVGLLEGRPDSRKSAGMGWGTFAIVME